MILKVNLSNTGNYGGTRDLSTIKYIVIHYTANDGDSDEGNGNYFKNNDVGASAHYFVDGDSVTLSVPEYHIAWSVGGAKYTNTKGGTFFAKCTNKNSISVELCDEVKNGISDFTEDALRNAVELVRGLMEKYSIPLSCVIRHYDVTGKPCPKPFIDEAKWQSFKKRLEGDTMQAELESLKKRVEDLENKDTVYNWTEACPKWSIPYVQKALDLGWIQGDENGFLNLTDDKIFTLVVMLRKDGIMK